jgi:hypothetical protein
MVGSPAGETGKWMSVLMVTGVPEAGPKQIVVELRDTQILDVREM